MPLLDATFHLPSGLPNKQLLAQFGPTIHVIVGHYAPPGATTAAPAQTEGIMALVDTGACESCIDNALAIRLGLPVIDTMQISGSNGIATHDVYLAQLNNVGLEFSQYGRFAGVHLTTGGQVHGVLLGRTFLDNVIMIYDGVRGQVTLSSPRIVSP
jgi:predicted aspartyl protease